MLSSLCRWVCKRRTSRSAWGGNGITTRKITYTRVQDATLCSESKMMDGVVMKWSSHLNKATNASRESLLVTLASAASTQLTGIGHFCT